MLQLDVVSRAHNDAQEARGMRPVCVDPIFMMLLDSIPHVGAILATTHATHGHPPLLSPARTQQALEASHTRLLYSNLQRFCVAIKCGRDRPGLKKGDALVVELLFGLPHSLEVVGEAGLALLLPVAADAVDALHNLRIAAQTRGS